MFREQENIQLRRELMTPYVTNRPQIDNPDEQGPQDSSLSKIPQLLNYISMCIIQV